jgi:hypothetical protein
MAYGLVYTLLEVLIHFPCPVEEVCDEVCKQLLVVARLGCVSLPTQVAETLQQDVCSS